MTCAQRPRLSRGEVAQDIKTLYPHHHPFHHHSHHHYHLLCLSCLLCFLRRLSLSLLDNRCTMLGNSARHRSLFAGNQRKDCGCERSRSIGIAQLLSQKVLRVCATYSVNTALDVILMPGREREAWSESGGCNLRKCLTARQAAQQLKTSRRSQVDQILVN